VARAGRTAGSTSAPPPGAQGTLGGRAQPTGAGPGKLRRNMVVGDEMYLWILVLAEVGAIAWLRNTFSRYHGG
jgi:hypothetical protein